MLKKVFKNKVILIIIGVVIVIVLVGVFWRGDVKMPEEPLANEGDLVGELGNQSLAEVNPGAIVAPLRSPDFPMPEAISYTGGTIIAIEKNGIKVKGAGNNFEDQISRELFVEFVAETIIFMKGQTERYDGLDGLKHLAVGDKVLINSPENIRGKTSFIANYINKAQ